MRKAILHTDGGSRGNPGIAGFGFDLMGEDGSTIADGGWYLPQATNNVAEYSALVWGLENALAARVTHIEVRADSELMVKQILGQYKVKSEDLKPLYMQAKELFARFDQAGIAHVYRSENKRADALANETMDARGPVGTYLVSWQGAPTSLFDFDEPASDISAMYGEIGDAIISADSEPGRKTYQELLAESGRSQDQGRDRYLEQDCVVHPESTAGGSCDTCASQIHQRGDQALEKNSLYDGPGKLSGETYEHAGGHYELTVKDHFDAAHTLPGYDGPCRYLHGHTWDVEVTIAGQHLDEVGILYDFKDIKRDLHAVLENFDHRYINDVKPFDVLNPTAEHLARIIFFELEKMLPSRISLKEIAVWESPSARLSYRP